MKPKDEAIITWILNVRKVGLSITLQLELKVVTHTKPTPFHNGVPRINWCYWFKRRHPKINIRIVKKLEFLGHKG
jgi:hypothetical protein